MGKITKAVYGKVEPKAILEIDAAFIMDYCVAKKQVKWLKAEAQKTVTGKDGKTRKASLFTIRKAFVLAFYPQLKKAPKKKPTFIDMIMALKD